MQMSRLSGDTLNGRNMTTGKPIIFYVISSHTDKMDSMEEDIARANWIWVTVRFDEDKGDYHYYFYTETLKINCVFVLFTGKATRSYFQVIGISPKTAGDRFISVKYGIRLVMAKNPKICSGEKWAIPEGIYTRAVSEQIVELAEAVESFKPDSPTGGHSLVKRKEWADKLKEIIYFQSDFEKQNSANEFCRYNRFSPVSSNKVIGVAYKFFLSSSNMSLEGIERRELTIAQGPIPMQEELKLRGYVVEINREEESIVIGFQSTIDFGKFPASGYLVNAVSNISYRIQAQAVDDLIQNKTINHYLLDIVVDGSFQEVPLYKHERMPKFCKAQEQAVNLAIATEDFLLVQGPPGTGKTHIIVEMIRRFVAQGKRVLISSKNNLAVDNVLEKCIDNGIPCIRLGREEAVKIEKVRKRLLDRAAVDLQQGIINNCSKQEIESLRLTDGQQRLIGVLHELQPQLSRHAQLTEVVIREQGRAANRSKIVKLKNFHRTLWLYVQKSAYFLTGNKVKIDEAAENYEREIEVRLNEDQEYTEATEIIRKSQNEQSVLQRAIDEYLDPFSAFCQFGYKDLSRAALTEALDAEELRLKEAQNKTAIIKNWKESLDERQQSLYPLLLNSVKVVGATCIGINTTIEFKDVEFDVALIDEAGQITIFDTLVPMSRAKKVILIGDHKQLPPVYDENALKEMLADEPEGDTLDSKEAEYQKLLGESLFETLFNTCPENNRVMLDEQFRMHPTIAEFISQEFYGGKYRSALQPDDRKLSISAFNKPLYFLDTADLGPWKEENTDMQDDHTVYYNATEAEIVSQILLNLFKDNGNPAEIGVITSYGRQRDEIRSTVKANLMRVYGENVAADLANRIEIDTVDSFQGRDKDIILFSFTRSNPEHKIGFLKELRRLNVTMTRAKYLLILVGDSETLLGTRDIASSKCFTNLLSYAKKYGVYQQWSSFKKGLWSEEIES